MAFVRRLLVAVLAAFSLGCYVGTPLAAPRPQVGTRVQLTLTDAGTVTMASQLGPARVELMGDVAAVSDSGLVLALRTVTNHRGVDEIWAGEQVSIPQSAIATMRQRTVSVKRSVLLAIVGVAAAMAIGLAIASGGTGSDGGREPGSVQ